MDGIINVYKEAGYTSFDVVAKLRGILKQKKIGHTGTLDPDAEGVLPVCVGKATKVCEYLTEKDKVYEAVLHLGIETDTQDISGTVLKERPVDITEADLRELIRKFVGKQKQIPPMYSALKVNGQKLCDLARKGVEVERKAREIEIYDIKLKSVGLPFVSMEVYCSKGTYIRTLCSDIGDAAGCGGCMENLLRTKTAGFSIENALRLDEIESVVKHRDKENRQLLDILIPVDAVLTDYPKTAAVRAADRLLKNGGRIPVGMTDAGEITCQECLRGDAAGEKSKEKLWRMYDAGGAFVGLYSYHPGYREFKVEKMFL